MKIKSLPNNYSGANSEAIYTITEAIPEQIIEATILTQDNKVLGIKHFTGETQYSVNIAGYLSRIFDIEPAGGTKSGFYKGADRTISAKLSIKQLDSLATPIVSQVRIFISAEQNAEIGSQMASDRKRGRIAPGEIDEISFVAPQKAAVAVVTIEGKAGLKTILIGLNYGSGEGSTVCYQCTAEVCSFILNMNDIVSEVGAQNIGAYSRMRVEIRSKNDISEPTNIDQMHLIAAREYTIAQPSSNSTRLCWLNPLGALDYYTFTGEQTQMLSVDKSRAYTQQGYKTYSSQAVLLQTLNSELEPQQNIEWLSEIATSPKVWVVDKELLTPVDIVTNSVILRSSVPVSLSVTMRSIHRKRF